MSTQSTKTWPVVVRFRRRSSSVHRIDYEAGWDTYGVALCDPDAYEHHFGLAEHERDVIVFTYVASYGEGGRETIRPHDLVNKLAADYEVVDAHHGPRLTPVVALALDDLAEFATHKGFAFDEEREAAVQFLGSLVLGGEPFDPEEVYVHAATSGYRFEDAQQLREYAERAISGRGTRTVNGYAIRVDHGRAKKMLADWRSRTEPP